MLKPQKKRQFNYKPRFSESQKETENSSVKKAFENKRKPKASTLPILLVILGLVIALMYYLDVKLR
ncbi:MULTISPECIES: hypothetical protein [unclassified Lacinutrix]|uniref:hypothetical protein n=1 Tax=unclassified Lacinutrix TaxID=2647285 RepID=UPI00020A3578|nr:MULTISPECIES: hypothetical protein [unclassified Lacinutrix]AEH01713.1 hypothetical protein Lacal_1867 [Lacinutrix sp. 5H-3-7-4]OIQ23041.1 MAG: hypothetical protein BM549_05840 [Lacinutrix sp. MedPE-SW]